MRAATVSFDLCFLQKIFILVAFFLTIPLCHAGTLKQSMTITLISAQGESLDIGKISFTPTDSGHEYKLSLDDDKFDDEFLSMRPFKCLKKPGVMVCHMDYPYANENTISEDNLMSLEYDFLFLHKTPEEYGINAWNGLYYKMEIINNKKIEGILHEVDLDVLAAPPEDGELRPISHGMLYKAEPAIHWFPRLSIH